METINSVATAAAKAVWGDDTANKEPVSGVKGNVSEGEPYDAGNLATPQQERLEQSFPGGQSETSAASKNHETTALPQHSESSSVPHRGTTTTSQNFENTSVPQAVRHDTASAQIDTRGPEKIPQNASKLHDVDTTTPGPSGKFSDGLESHDSRPSEGLDSHPLEGAAIKRDDRGGNLGKVATSNPPESKSLVSKVPESEIPHSKIPETKALGSTPQNKGSESEGTGQEYVKTSGFAADGGDFDATKPGAGREADRLLDEKGVHPNGGDSSHHGSGKDKPSLGERIKAKLHKH